MKTIPLTQGKVALVDDADFEAVNQFKWYAHRVGRNFYVARNIRKPNGKKTMQYLHQFLMPGAPRIDHRDGNGCNGQRKNMRPATNQQNAHGFCRKRSGTTSRFRGVDWYKAYGKWRARIRVGGKDLNLGYFEEESDAARAFDLAALKYRGEFAYLNFPI